MSPAMPSRSRVVVITGAASGVGLATMRMMRQAGDFVIGVDLADAPDEASGATDVEWIRGDVADQVIWDRVRSAASRKHRAGADALIACAAGLVVEPFLETAIDQWRRIFEMNVFGVIRSLQMLLPAMLASGEGAVAVVCSVNSLFVEDRLSAYSVSKAALLHVVRSAALEHARRGVRINAVCPGAIDTPLLRRHLNALPDPDAALKAIEKRTPCGRLIKPEEVAAVLRFLVSPDASGMSGAAVVVDGGLTTAYDFDSTS